MKIDFGIIGGTGIGDRLLQLDGYSLHIPTRSGIARGRVVIFEGVSIFVMSRHSAGHKVPPHRVNYPCMALAMQALEVNACFSTAAVGSLRESWLPGTLVSCSDFLDLTGRNLTLFNQTVAHRDFTKPFAPAARQALIDAGAGTVVDGALYGCANGPRYETPAEIELYRNMGIDLVGMTAASEAILMREALVPYACLAIVTNLAAGISTTPLDHREVVDEMIKTGPRVVDILLKASRAVGRGL